MTSSGSAEALEIIKRNLMSCFFMKDMGEASLEFGMCMTRDRGVQTLSFDQLDDTRSQLEHLGMEESVLVSDTETGRKVSME